MQRSVAKIAENLYQAVKWLHPTRGPVALNRFLQASTTLHPGNRKAFRKEKGGIQYYHYSLSSFYTDYIQEWP